MSDIVLGGLIFIPPFFRPFLLGFVLWLVSRGIYAKAVYRGFFWHPNLIDISLLFIWVYISHRIIVHSLGA